MVVGLAVPIPTLPVKIWVSSELLPNCVDPDWYIVDADTNVVWNSLAVIVPVTVRSPPTDTFPAKYPPPVLVIPATLVAES